LTGHVLPIKTNDFANPLRFVQEVPDMLAGISKVEILVKIHLLVLQGVHQALGIRVLGWLGMSRWLINGQGLRPCGVG
jgi:hypothetical protein